MVFRFIKNAIIYVILSIIEVSVMLYHDTFIRVMVFLFLLLHIFFPPLFLLPSENLVPEKVTWYARKFPCSDDNCKTNDLKNWSDTAFTQIQREWNGLKDLFIIKDPKRLWIPLKAKDSLALEMEWQTLYGCTLETKDKCLEKSKAKLYQKKIKVMNKLYDAHLHQNFGSLSPIYWEDERDKWLLLRSEWCYEIAEAPDVAYFTDILPNATMKTFYQPVPAWLVSTYVSNSRFHQANPTNFFETIYSYIFTYGPFKFYYGNPMDDDFAEDTEPTDVIFVVHGLGHRHGEKDIVGNTNDIRNGFIKYIKKFHPNYKIPLLIPIAWRHGLMLNDEIVRAIPSVKGSFVGDVGLFVNDVIYYLKRHKETILESLIKELLEKHQIFNRIHPKFNGKFSILAHSLGSVITYDMLNEKSNKLKKLKIENVFLIGSPLPLFLASDGITGEKLKQNEWIREGRLFNIIHGNDPIAHRLEILFNIDYKYVEPFSLFLHRQFRTSFSEVVEISEYEEIEIGMLHQRLNDNRNLAASHDSFLKYEMSSDDNRTSGFLRKMFNVFNGRNIELFVLNETKEIEKIPFAKRIPHRFDFDLFMTEHSKDPENQMPFETVIKFGMWAKEFALSHMSYWERPELILFMTNIINKHVPEKQFNYTITSQYFNSDRRRVNSYDILILWITRNGVKFFIGYAFSAWLLHHYLERNNYPPLVIRARPRNVLFEMLKVYWRILWDCFSNMNIRFFVSFITLLFCLTFLHYATQMFYSLFTLTYIPADYEICFYFLLAFPGLINLKFSDQRLNNVNSVNQFLRDVALTCIVILSILFGISYLALMSKEYDLGCRNPISASRCRQYEMYLLHSNNIPKKALDSYIEMFFNFFNFL